jgi:glycosyltransferase involved in cell wall biosynthesis
MSRPKTISNIVYITRLFYPHIGGVEKHVMEISNNLAHRGYNVTVVTEKYDVEAAAYENINGIKIVRFSYPHFWFIGVASIWVWLLNNRKLIHSANIIHIHDVFIWYLPFCFIYPRKIVVTTIHGLEWDNPLNKVSILQKRLAAMFSNRTVGVGKFLEKYLRITFSKIIYGAVKPQEPKFKKKDNTLVYVGRLEENTGLIELLHWLKPKNYKVDFCGDGRLREECEKYGTVHGFCDPTQFYKTAKYSVPGGYLAALEALSFNCELKLFWHDKIKKDYWKISPFTRCNVKSWAMEQTWDKLADEYINLYNSIK